MTYYDITSRVGACGESMTVADHPHPIAVSADLMDQLSSGDAKNTYCNNLVKIRTALGEFDAIVKDICSDCEYYGIDCTDSLFKSACSSEDCFVD
jgi:hypothetical protein